jgi:hypothetical protein
VFTVNESATSHYVTFVERFPIDIRNATIHTSRVTQGDVSFKIKIYSNGTDTMSKGYVCVDIGLLKRQQTVVNLFAIFNIKARNAILDYVYESGVLGGTLRETETYILKILGTVINQATKVFADGDILTIEIIGSYLIHSQRKIATSQANFDPKTHTSVITSYTWTVCNLTMRLTDKIFLRSEKVFSELGVADFIITVTSGLQVSDFIAIFSQLITLNNIKLPLRVRHTFELLNNSLPEHAVVDKFSMSVKYVLPAADCVSAKPKM